MGPVWLLDFRWESFVFSLLLRFLQIDAYGAVASGKINGEV
jgi:hypothetical protein